MDKLAAPGCLVVVWVTNRMKHLKFVKETLFPNWAVTHLAEWHWLKVIVQDVFEMSTIMYDQGSSCWNLIFLNCEIEILKGQDLVL